MKQKMKRISFIRLIGNHTLSSGILGIHCSPNGLKLHLLCVGTVKRAHAQ